MFAVFALHHLNVLSSLACDLHVLAHLANPVGVFTMQEGQLLSFGRPTYGRMGRLDVSPKSDDCVPEAKPVDNLPGVTVAGMAAGQFPTHAHFYCQPHTYTAEHEPHLLPSLSMLLVAFSLCHQCFALPLLFQQYLGYSCVETIMSTTDESPWPLLPWVTSMQHVCTPAP